MGTVAKPVSDFHPRRGKKIPSGRADVYFEGLSLKGSGKRLRRSSALRMSEQNIV